MHDSVMYYINRRTFVKKETGESAEKAAIVCKTVSHKEALKATDGSVRMRYLRGTHTKKGRGCGNIFSGFSVARVRLILPAPYSLPPCSRPSRRPQLSTARPAPSRSALHPALDLPARLTLPATIGKDARALSSALDNLAVRSVRRPALHRPSDQQKGEGVQQGVQQINHYPPVKGALPLAPIGWNVLLGVCNEVCNRF